MASGSVEKKIFAEPKNCEGSYTITSGGNARVTKTTIGNDIDSSVYYGVIRGFTCGSTSERPVGYVQTDTSSAYPYAMYIENVGTSTTGRKAGLYITKLAKKYVKEA